VHEAVNKAFGIDMNVMMLLPSSPPPGSGNNRYE